MNVDESNTLASKARQLVISPEMLALISDLDAYRGVWRVANKMEPERLESLQKIATIESIGSSTRIEGARLSDRQVESLLSGIEIDSFGSRDEQEVAGYAEVMDLIFESFAAIGMSENNVLQLHRDLLKHSVKDERHRGAYKKLNNHVEAFSPAGKSLGVVFETAIPFHTPARMQSLFAWRGAVEQSAAMHPLLATAIFAVEFLAIHPFQDGNGRLSRILTTLQLMRAGYGYVPFSSLESVIESSKEDYYLALRQTKASLGTEEANWNLWVLYFLRALAQQKSRLVAKLGEPGARSTALPELSAAILLLARTRGRVTVADAVRESAASRNTLNDHFKALVKSGRIQRHGAGRGSWYSIP